MTKRFYQETFMTDETHEEQHISLMNRPIVKCRNLVSRFEALRLQLSSVQYYDPFQKEQQNEEVSKFNNNNSIDDDSYCVIERPAKRQRSFVSTVVDSVVNGLLYSAASVYEYVWAQPQSIDEQYREKINAYHVRQISKTSKKQSPKMRGQGVDYNFSQQSNHTFFNLRQDEQPIRDIFLRTQRAALSKCNNNKKMNNYTMISDARKVEDNWGLVDKENYDVDFLPTLPRKPPRHVPVKSLGLFGNQVSSLGFNINNKN